MFDKLDLELLRFVSDRENYERYNGFITKAMCIPESYQLVRDFGAYFKDNPEADAIDTDFNLWMRVERYPSWKPEKHKMFAEIVNNALSLEMPDNDEFVERLDKIGKAEQCRQLLQKLDHGSITFDEYSDEVMKLHSSGPAKTEDTLVDLSLGELSTKSRGTSGLYWRTEDLNKAIGPLDKGDLVIIAKRPEVGGTSFLVSEMSYMLEQMDNGGRAIIFNNEESPDKVYTRMVSAALDVDYKTLLSDPVTYDKKFEDWLNGREWDLCHDTNMTITSVLSTLKAKEYDLIGINVLLKVGGTNYQEDHDRLQALGTEMRRIAQLYGPVLCIVQADPTAEGLKYIPQDRIYKSKTALQGEADVQIMIGAGDEETRREDIRYIYVAKNKIPPAPCTEIRYKHIKTEVNFDVATGRFTSRNFTGNSYDDYH